MPLGDSALLVRFGAELDEHANRAAVGFASRVRGADAPAAVLEVVSSLVSVLVRFDPLHPDAPRLAGELRLLVSGAAIITAGDPVTVAVTFDGADLAEVSASLGLSPAGFVARHNLSPLRVLAIGFAPGFVYCGFHPSDLRVPRRRQVRRSVPAGTVLFAAGQTAITATDVPTGWHVIGRTDFRNFDPQAPRPVALAAGDLVRFEDAA